MGIAAAVLFLGIAEVAPAAADADTTRPEVTVDVHPSAPDGANGWYHDAPTVVITASDDVAVDYCEYSFSAETTPYTGPFVLPLEGRVHLVGRCYDTSGNIGRESKDILVDRTIPHSVGINTPAVPDPETGWYVTSPSFAVTGADLHSGIEYCQYAVGDSWWNVWEAPLVIADGEWEISGRCIDWAGNISPTVSRAYDVDTVAPSIGFSGNDGTYGVDDIVSIDCVATDATSGIAEETCPTVSGVPGYELVGTNVLEATATDVAGNRAEESTSFTVVVDASDVASLVDELVDDPEVADGMNAKLAGIDTAPNAMARAGKCGALRNQVAAEQGNSLTEAEAAILLGVIDHLC